MSPQLVLAQPATLPTQSTGRIEQLDGARALAIMAVFLHHSVSAPLLWMGVDVFFVLSGFLITGILLRLKEEKRDRYFRHFYSRRARRILLPYGLALIAATALFGTAWTRYWYWFAFFLTNIGSAFGQTGHESLVVLWSLAVEEQFYLFWPVAVLLLSERKLLWIAATVVLAGPLLRAVATPLFQTCYPIYFLTPFRMDLLCAGAVLAIGWRKYGQAVFMRMVRPAWILFATAVAALAIVTWRFPSFKTISNTPWTNSFIYAFGLVFAVCIVVLSLGEDRWVCYLFRLPIVRFVGILSYSMYLIHMSIIVAVREYVTHNRAAVFGIALVLTFGYATATWYGFERRLLKSGKA